MTKVLQRKPRQKQEEIQDDEIIQALTKDVIQQRSKSQKYQSKSKTQLIEDQLKRMPAFNTEITKPRPQAVSRTGLKPRILGGQPIANYYKNDRSNSSFENLRQFRNEIRAKVFAQSRPNVKMSTQQDIEDEVSRNLSDVSFQNQLSPGGKYQYYDQKVQITPRNNSITTPLKQEKLQTKPKYSTQIKNPIQSQKVAKKQEQQKSEINHPSQIPSAPAKINVQHPDSHLENPTLAQHLPDQAAQQKHIYKCKTCGTPLLNLTFLKDEVLSDDQLLCQLCIEKKYKEMQLLQLQLLNKKSQQRQQQLEQIAQKVEEENGKENDRLQQQQSQQSEQNTFLQQQQNLQLELINKNIENLKLALESKNQQIQDLQTQILRQNEATNKNSSSYEQKVNIQQQQPQTNVIQGNKETAQDPQVDKNTINTNKNELYESISPSRQLQNLAEADLSLSKTTCKPSPEKRVAALQQQMNELQQQIQQLTEYKAQKHEQQPEQVAQLPVNTNQGPPVTVLQINPPMPKPYDIHEHTVKSNKTLNLLGRLNDELLQNFPFVIQKRVCSVCGKVLGVQVIDPRNQNKKVSNSELKETIRLAASRHPGADDNQKQSQPDDNQARKQRQQSDLEYYKKPKQNNYNNNEEADSSLWSDAAQKCSRRKKKKLEKLLQLEERLGQLQLHDTAIINTPQRIWAGVSSGRENMGINDIHTDPIAAAEIIKQEEMIYIVNEAPGEESVSGTGDLGFRVRRGGV